MEDFTAEEITRLKAGAARDKLAEAKAAARQTRDDLIAAAQVIYTAARKTANDAYDVDVAALDAEG